MNTLEFQLLTEKVDETSKGNLIAHGFRVQCETAVASRILNDFANRLSSAGLDYSWVAFAPGLDLEDEWYLLERASADNEPQLIQGFIQCSAQFADVSKEFADVKSDEIRHVGGDLELLKGVSGLTILQIREPKDAALRRMLAGYLMVARVDDDPTTNSGFHVVMTTCHRVQRDRAQHLLATNSGTIRELLTLDTHRQAELLQIMSGYPFLVEDAVLPFAANKVFRGSTDIGAGSNSYLNLRILDLIAKRQSEIQLAIETFIKNLGPGHGKAVVAAWADLPNGAKAKITGVSGEYMATFNWEVGLRNREWKAVLAWADCYEDVAEFLGMLLRNSRENPRLIGFCAAPETMTERMVNLSRNFGGLGLKLGLLFLADGVSRPQLLKPFDFDV